MAKKKEKWWKRNLSNWGFTWLMDHAAATIIGVILPVMLATFAGVKAWLCGLPWDAIREWIMITILAAVVIPYTMVKVWKGWSEILHPCPPPKKRKKTLRESRKVK